MKQVLAAACLPVLLTACAAKPDTAPLPSPSGPPLTWAALGERVYVDGPEVTPLEVLEDSRCPVDVQCVWAGRVRVRATIHLGGGGIRVDLISGKPIHIADGSFELVEIKPARTSEAAIAPGDYRFGFRFMGGL